MQQRSSGNTIARGLIIPYQQLDRRHWRDFSCDGCNSVSTSIRQAFDARSTAYQRSLNAHCRNRTTHFCHADLFTQIGRSAAARSCRRTSNGHIAVELQSNRSRFVVVTAAELITTCDIEPSILKHGGFFHVWGSALVFSTILFATHCQIPAENR